MVGTYHLEEAISDGDSDVIRDDTDTQAGAHSQVNGVSRAMYKGYATEAEARDAFNFARGDNIVSVLQRPQQQRKSSAGAPPRPACSFDTNVSFQKPSCPHNLKRAVS